MKKNGFIATSIMYSFFAVFSIVALFTLASYSHYRTLIDNINDGVLDELNTLISGKYLTLYNLIIDGDFDDTKDASPWNYTNSQIIKNGNVSTSINTSYSGDYAARLKPKTTSQISQSFTIQDKVNQDGASHKIYVAYRISSNGPNNGTNSIVLNASGNNYNLDSTPLNASFNNWNLYSQIISVNVNSDADWSLAFNINNNTNNTYTFLDNIMVIDISDMYNSSSVTDIQMKTYLDTNLNYFNGSYSISKISKEYMDTSGASVPELYQGMIPVTYDASGNVIVANTTQEWYDYSSHNWANAVLVNCADTTIKDKYFNYDMSIKTSVVGTTIPMSNILQMYVWIPRYKYLLWNAANGSSNPQAITIIFEDKTTAKSTGSTNGTYLTHPAFTFGTTELNGIWVGKFENSGATTGLTIKPNITSLRSTKVGDMFNATRNQELTYSANYGIDSTSIDTHMMKNMEWGAVAYLSSSIYGRYNDASTCITSGCETWINNNSGFITGCAGATVSASQDLTNTTSCASGYDWTALGVNASTTGNQYGIYDMSGGSWEYVMGNMVDSTGAFYPSSSGLTQPDTKYYDSYTYGTSYTDHARGKLGDATKETLKTFGSETGGWNGDYAYFPHSTNSWFLRGGNYGDGSYAGVFHFGRGGGGLAGSYGSFRSAVVSAQ